MILKHILALAALLVATACTSDGNPPQTAASTSAGTSGGVADRTGQAPSLPRDVERVVGGAAYRDRALHAYVERVGQRVVTQGGVPGGGFRFFVLDQPTPNAHALSSGYVFITRGLLAMLDDEAELAAALAHELSHLSQRHAAQRTRAYEGAMAAAVDAARTTGSTAIGQSVARDGLLALRRYSREQELEADRVGLGFIHKAGYRGDAMATLIDKLKRDTQLEALFIGVAPEAADRRSVASTHPASDERVAALRALDIAPGGESGREPFLAALDGMAMGDSPEEGFVRGTSFLHPTLKFAFEVPRDFRMFNEQDGVLAVGRDRSLIYFTCAPDRVPGRLADWMRDQVKPTPSDIQSTAIGGAEAAIGQRPRGSDTGLANVRYVMIRRASSVCIFNLRSEGADADRRIETLVAAARSFRTLGDSEAAALRPWRLRVVPLGGTPVPQLAARLPYADYRMERLLVLNGVDNAAELARKRVVKTVEP